MVVKIEGGCRITILLPGSQIARPYIYIYILHPDQFGEPDPALSTEPVAVEPTSGDVIYFFIYIGGLSPFLVVGIGEANPPSRACLRAVPHFHQVEASDCNWAWRPTASGSSWGLRPARRDAARGCGRQLASGSSSNCGGRRAAAARIAAVGEGCRWGLRRAASGG